MSINYPNGTGQSTGDSLVTTFPLIASGQILYVNSATGDDILYDGVNEARPFATWVAAFAAADAHDIIVLMDGHAETINQQTFAKDNVVTLGAGSAAGLPTVKIAFTGGGTHGLTISGYANQVRNVWFQSFTSSTVASHLRWSGDNGKMVGCYFECGANDGEAGLNLAGNTFTIIDTTFISTAELSTAQPALGMLLSASSGEGGSHATLRMQGCVFDGGTHGFSNPWALDSMGIEIVQVEVESLSLLRGADARLDGGGNSLGWINPMVTTGGSNVRF